MPDRQPVEIINRLIADFDESRAQFPLEVGAINSRELLVALANENRRIVEALRELAEYLANRP